MPAPVTHDPAPARSASESSPDASRTSSGSARLGEEWEAVPAAPLSPRERAHLLWTGSELLVFGGSEEPCPPTADCVFGRPALRDGASFHPVSGSWRSIADAPVPIDQASAALVGRVVYMWVPGFASVPESRRAFLSYDIAADEWNELALPPRGRGAFRRLVAARDRVIAYLDSHEGVHKTDLPSGEWRVLPVSESIGTGPWMWINDRAVYPALGGADGGRTNGWDRTYPYGGILDPATGEWSELPPLPAEGLEFTAGVVGSSEAAIFAHDSWILDLETERWLRPPNLDGGSVEGRSTVWAGDRAIAFGGVDWSKRGGELLADAWSLELALERPSHEASERPDRAAPREAPIGPASDTITVTCDGSDLAVPIRVP